MTTKPNEALSFAGVMAVLALILLVNYALLMHKRVDRLQTELDICGASR